MPSNAIQCPWQSLIKPSNLLSKLLSPLIVAFSNQDQSVSAILLDVPRCSSSSSFSSVVLLRSLRHRSSSTPIVVEKCRRLQPSSTIFHHLRPSYPFFPLLLDAQVLPLTSIVILCRFRSSLSTVAVVDRRRSSLSSVVDRCRSL
jgi:hypothetical protein